MKNNYYFFGQINICECNADIFGVTIYRWQKNPDDHPYFKSTAIPWDIAFAYACHSLIMVPVPAAELQDNRAVSAVTSSKILNRQRFCDRPKSSGDNSSKQFPKRSFPRSILSAFSD